MESLCTEVRKKNMNLAIAISRPKGAIKDEGSTVCELLMLNFIDLK